MILPSLTIESEFQGLIPPLLEEEFKSLEESIIKEGCRDKLVVWNGILIDGHNRYKICQKHNISFRIHFIEFSTKDQAKIWIINNQLARRNLTTEQKNDLLGYLYKLYKKPEGNPNLHFPTNVGKIPTLSSNTPKKTSEIIAEKFNVDESTVRKAEKYHDDLNIIAKNVGDEAKQKILKREIKSTANDIKEIAKKDPKEQKRIINYAVEQQKDLRYARSKIERKVTEEKLDPSSLPQDEFEIIYADPPWRYDWPITENRAREKYYPTMELNDIKELKIPATENAILFLWALAPKIQDALDVMKAWGFQYRTHAIWDKETIGTGFWFRGQHELLFLGIKGKIKTPESENRYSSIIRQKKTDHSRKPDIVYDMIEQMFPNRKYLELFARQQYSDKWTVWGNQL